jgi:hypothetical protein
MRLFRHHMPLVFLVAPVGYEVLSYPHFNGLRVPLGT